MQNEQKKQEVLDYFGEILIKHVRDISLKIAMDICNYTTVNPGKREQYKSLSSLTVEQRDSICDLLSETISDTIFNFLDMFEAYQDEMKIIIMKDGEEYDLNEISEKMGAEIAFMEDGWIQRFSEIGRFVL